MQTATDFLVIDDTDIKSMFNVIQKENKELENYIGTEELNKHITEITYSKMERENISGEAKELELLYEVCGLYNKLLAFHLKEIENYIADESIVPKLLRSKFSVTKVLKDNTEDLTSQLMALHKIVLEKGLKDETAINLQEASITNIEYTIEKILKEETVLLGKSLLPSIYGVLGEELRHVKINSTIYTDIIAENSYEKETLEEIVQELIKKKEDWIIK